MLFQFITPHGSYELSCSDENKTLFQLCWENKIPANSVSFYGDTYNENSIIIGLHEPIKNLKSRFLRIVIRPDRNIDYWSLCNKTIKENISKEAVAEYTFPGGLENGVFHYEFSTKKCKEYVQSKVTDFINNESNFNTNSKIVVGVSGGGDSNTLIEALLGTGKISKDQIQAVMILGIPDWDKGSGRAIEICNQHQIPLKFVSPEEINALLGRRSNKDWVEDFEKMFPDADLEVLGTLAVRLALISTAKRINAQAIVTGHNLEDILAECFLTTIQGELPLPFPVRKIDEMSLWYPLYNIPKKILDGCNPKFSVENYVDRYPSKMKERALVYYLAQMMNSINPGIEFDLLKGFKKLSELNVRYFHFDKDLGFSTVKEVSKELKNRWMMFTQM